MIERIDGRLRCCNCRASAADNTKERGRFKRRHPSRCIEHQNKQTERAIFTQQLAEGVRSVEDNG